MDLWKIAELGLPLIVTVVLAWVAIHVETKRSRTDRRETWKYERTKAAINEYLTQIDAAIPLAHELSNVDRLEKSVINRYFELHLVLLNLSKGLLMPSPVQRDLQNLRDEGPFSRSTSRVGIAAEKYSNWADRVDTTLRASRLAITEYWALHGDDWEVLVNKSAHEIKSNRKQSRNTPSPDVPKDPI